MIEIRRLISNVLPCLLWLVWLLPLSSAVAAPDDGSSLSRDILPPLNDQPGKLYRTPRAGESFRTEVFGREVIVEPRDRRFMNAWDLSVALYEPPPEDSGIIPIGVIELWRHPDDDHLFRAELSGLYNNVFWSAKLPGSHFFEWVFTFENLTVPFAQAEHVDGKSIDSQELVWGYVRPGFGVGYRQQVSPGYQDNMFAVDLMIQPEYLYFHSGSNTAHNFMVPSDTFVLSTTLQVRLDALERNLLELPHYGIAAGADVTFGRREHWDDWGVNGSGGNAGANYQSYAGYFLAAGGVPGVGSDRHRLVAGVHVGFGRNLDRFSAPRVGGGPHPMGEEYGSTAYPILPGAAVAEFFPSHYALATVEYRWEPIFFAYLGINATVGRLDRQRFSGSEIVDKTDSFTALGARVTSGFLFRTRVQLAYTYNFDVVREGKYGGNEIVLNVSKNF